MAVGGPILFRIEAAAAAPAVRRVVLDYFGRAGVDLKVGHELHTVVHAISMITSVRAVMLLPAYTKQYQTVIAAGFWISSLRSQRRD